MCVSWDGKLARAMCERAYGVRREAGMCDVCEHTACDRREAGVYYVCELGMEAGVCDVCEHTACDGKLACAM